MVLVKTKLRNKMGDSLLDDCLVTFMERAIFFQADEDDIINTFMSVRKRRINSSAKYFHGPEEGCRNTLFQVFLCS
jgi:hypothetical protein